MTDVEVLIIASRDDPSAGWLRAEGLTLGLAAQKIKVRLINKLTFDLDELHLVARYRAVSTPTVLILKGGEIVGRLLGIPSARTVADLVRLFEPAIPA